MRYFKSKKSKKTKTTKTTKTRRLITSVFIITLLATGLVTSSAVYAASLVVIGNPQLKLKKLTRKQLANIYLGNAVSLPHGVRVEPINLSASSLGYQKFYQKILGWSPSQVSSYWSSMLFSGSGNQPQTASSAKQAIAAVKKYPTAIAYVMSNELKGKQGFKVLYGKYTPPPPPVKNNAYYHSVDGVNSAGNNDSGYHSMYSVPAQSSQAMSSSSQQATSVTSADAEVSADNKQLASELAEELSNLRNQKPYNDADVIAKGPHTGNVWKDIQQSIHIKSSVKNNPRVRREVNYFAHHPGIIKMMLNNATPYIYYVYQQTRLRHMPTKFALLPMVESGYDPNAYSYAGAAGLWQMMPGTATGYRLNINWFYDERRDVLTSTNAALNYLVQLHRQLGSWYLAAAGYNAGAGTVEDAERDNRRHGRPTDYWALPLPKQTRNYDPKLIALAEIIKNASHFGIKLPNVPDKPFFVAFKMNSQLDMDEIARFSGVSEAVIRKLNPGFRRYASSPKGEYTLLIPASNAREFANNLAKVAGKKHRSWQYHEVHQNESLSDIARNYHTSVALLKKVNQLSSNRVNTGEGILVPLWLNKTYQNPVGVINLANDSTVASVQPQSAKISQSQTAKAAPPQAKERKQSQQQSPKGIRIKVKNTAMPKINTHLPASIKASQLLSGKLPSLSSRQKKAVVNQDAISSSQEKSHSPVQNLPVVQSTSTTTSKAAQRPITKKESLKSLLEKLYAK